MKITTVAVAPLCGFLTAVRPACLAAFSPVAVFGADAGVRRIQAKSAKVAERTRTGEPARSDDAAHVLLTAARERMAIAAAAASADLSFLLRGPARDLLPV